MRLQHLAAENGPYLLTPWKEGVGVGGLTQKLRETPKNSPSKSSSQAQVFVWDKAKSRFHTL